MILTKTDKNYTKSMIICYPNITKMLPNCNIIEMLYMIMYGIIKKNKYKERLKMEFKDTVMGRITKDALMNPDWNGLTEEEAERKVQEFGTAENARDNVTYGSEIAAIEGIAKVVELSDEEKEALTEAIYTQGVVPEKIAEKMREKLEPSNKSESVIRILSDIHDNWVRTNGKKFDGRMKNYQFVDLRLLSLKEAQADLLFVKPILEAAGIEIPMVELEGSLEIERNNLLKANGIDSLEKLVEKISEGADFYPALEGVQTNRTGEATEISEEGAVREEGESKDITDILKEQPEVAEKMARQVVREADLEPEFQSMKERQEFDKEVAAGKYGYVSDEYGNLIIVERELDEQTSPEKMAEYSEAIQDAEETIRDEVTRDDKTNGLDGQDDGNR